MPVPRFISASCGISVRIRPDRRENAEEIFRESSKLTPEDYAYYHVLRDPETGDIQCDKIAHSCSQHQVKHSVFKANQQIGVLQHHAVCFQVKAHRP